MKKNIKKELIAYHMAINEDLRMAVSSCGTEKSYAYVMEEIRAFAQMIATTIPGYLDKLTEKNGMAIDPVLTSDAIRQKTDELKNNIIKLLLESMELLSDISSYAPSKNAVAEEKLRLLCCKQGEIALLLRFDLMWEYSFQDEAGGESLEQLMHKVRSIGAELGDYYTLNPLWKISMKKYLPEIDCRDTAIVMQGPIEKKDDFTIESLMYYRKIYPNTLIILSTWEGEADGRFLWIAEGIGIVVLQSVMPADRGVMNIKLQLTNTRNGICFAKDHTNIKYVLKTRTDQRIFLPDFLQYLKNLVKVFKPKESSVDERLIFLGGRNSSITSPFVISDFLSFGRIEEIEKLYACSGEHSLFYEDSEADSKRNCELKLERYLYENANAMNCFDEAIQDEYKVIDNNCLVPESYIIRTYYEDYILGRKLSDDDRTLQHYWAFLKSSAIIVDYNQLMIYWDKYADRYLYFNSLTSENALNFNTWLDIYSSWDGTAQ